MKQGEGIACPNCSYMLDEKFIRHARAIINGRKGGAPKGNTNAAGHDGSNAGRPKRGEKNKN